MGDGLEGGGITSLVKRRSGGGTPYSVCEEVAVEYQRKDR